MLDTPHLPSLVVSFHRSFLTGLFLVILTATSITAISEDVTALPPLEGVWFTCEFATRQGPPDDGCIMFDDEGFAVEDGKIAYLRNIASEEQLAAATKPDNVLPLTNRPSPYRKERLGLPVSKAGNYWFPILAVPKNLTCSLRQIMSVLSRQKINVSGRAIVILCCPL